MYDLYILGFVWDFVRLYLFVNWWNLIWICDLDVYDEINNGLFNGSILFFLFYESLGANQ
jgi:hypothetical protein